MKINWYYTATAITVSLMLWGCFGSAPISRFYLLDYVPTSQEMLKNKPYPITIRIKDFTIAEAYERPEIVYRKSAHELRFYNFHQWAVKPEHLLSDMIFKHIRVSKLFSNTVKSIVDTKPDYVMTGQILAIEEYDNKETWYAHLAINFQLEEEDTKKIVWQHSYDVRKEVAQHEPVYVVRELSYLLENTMDKVIEELNELFTKKYPTSKRQMATPKVAKLPPLPKKPPETSSDTTTVDSTRQNPGEK